MRHCVKDGRSLASLAAAAAGELARDTEAGELAAEAAAELAEQLAAEPAVLAEPVVPAGLVAEAAAVGADASSELAAEAGAAIVVGADAAARARLGANVTSTGCAFAVWVRRCRFTPAQVDPWLPLLGYSA